MKRQRIVIYYIVALILLIFADLVMSLTGAFEALLRAIGLGPVVGSSQAVAILIATLILFRTVLRKLKGIELAVGEIGEGEKDLTRRIKVERDPLIRAFARGINIFIAKIHNLIMKMKIVNDAGRSTSQRLDMSAAELSSAIEQIAASINNMRNNEELLHANIQTAGSSVADIRGAIKNVASQIETQAGSMATSSSAIDEMIASIHSIEKIATSKQDVIAALSKRATESVESMEENLALITAIADSADSISEFSQIIEAIASQTNILAMNACHRSRARRRVRQRLRRRGGRDPQIGRDDRGERDEHLFQARGNHPQYPCRPKLDVPVRSVHPCHDRHYRRGVAKRDRNSPGPHGNDRRQRADHRSRGRVERGHS